jgi:RNA polymerase sigma factor (sigma-70 family)
LAETLDYLLEVAARYPLLTAQQEIELGRQIRRWQDHPDGPDNAPAPIQRRGRRALDKFLACNLRLACYVARRYDNRGVPMEDLMQAASEGLLTAYRRFDPSKGYRSSSYSVWWAQQACQILVAQQGNGLRLPTTVSEQLRKVGRVTEVLAKELGRTPSAAEVEERAGLKPGQLEDLQASGHRARVLSLDYVLLEEVDGTHTLLDLIESPKGPTASLERKELMALLLELIEHSSVLSPQQRFILKCRYLSDEPPSIARLASQLNMNRETLRRMERQALQNLKTVLPAEILDYQSAP